MESFKKEKLKVCVFTNGLKKNTYAWPSLNAFAQGVKTCNDHIQFVEKPVYKPCDIAVIFGDIREAPGKSKRMPNQSQVKGRHIRRGLIVIDTAILTRPTHVGSQYRRIGIDGFLRNEADFANIGMPSDRWNKVSTHANLKMNPWRTDGDHITIVLQRPFDASLKSSQRLRPQKYKTWLLELISQLQNKSDFPIHIRPHPGSLGQIDEEKWLQNIKDEAPKNNIIWDTRSVSFEQAMEKCRLCVTYNSGAGVDAALLGIPVMTCDSGSFAWDVAVHDLNQWNPDMPYTPDRQQWLNNMSYVEWNLDEITNGEPWMHLRSRLMESF